MGAGRIHYITREHALCNLNASIKFNNIFEHNLLHCLMKSDSSRISKKNGPQNSCCTGCLGQGRFGYYRSPYVQPGPGTLRFLSFPQNEKQLRRKKFSCDEGVKKAVSTYFEDKQKSFLRVPQVNRKI